MDIQQFIPRPRWLAHICEGLDEFPVVALLGSRQVGKTTLASLFASPGQSPTTTYDLEEYAAPTALSVTPDRLLHQSEGLVILDEAQRLPSLFEVLRPICDEPGRRAVFLLLGRVSLDLVKGLSESLAGRVRFLDVAGLSVDEVGAESQDRLWMRAGLPREFLAPSSAA